MKYGDAAEASCAFIVKGRVVSASCAFIVKGRVVSRMKFQGETEAERPGHRYPSVLRLHGDTNTS